MSDAITHNPNTGEELARYPQMSDNVRRKLKDEEKAASC